MRVLLILLLCLTLPGLARAGCQMRTMCEAGTSVASSPVGPCLDSSGAEIVTTVNKGGRHTAYLVPDAAGRTCTVNIMDGVEYDSAYNTGTQVGQMTCAGVLSFNLSGPSDALWFQLASTMGAGSFTAYIKVCD
jgi:hypothetical protein